MALEMARLDVLEHPGFHLAGTLAMVATKQYWAWVANVLCLPGSSQSYRTSTGLHLERRSRKKGPTPIANAHRARADTRITPTKRSRRLRTLMLSPEDSLFRPTGNPERAPVDVSCVSRAYMFLGRYPSSLPIVLLVWASQSQPCLSIPNLLRHPRLMYLKKKDVQKQRRIQLQ
jgi:hypothetical protein